MSTANRGRLSPEGTALLEWFNYLPTSGPSKATLDDLSDGSKIWDALQRLDPDYFEGPLPEEAVRGTGSWLSSWGNLKHIHKRLADYIESTNGRPLPSGSGTVDLKQVAKGEDPEGTAKACAKESSNDSDTDFLQQLLRLLLFTAINASDNEEFIGALMSLSEDKQLLLQNAIVEFQNDSHVDEDTGMNKPASADKDLFFEEQLGRLTQESNRLAREKKELQRDVRDLHNRNTRLQEHNGVLQEKLVAAEEKLEEPAESVGQSFLKEIESRIHQQEELIANQETQLADAQRTINGLRVENNKFRASHEKFQPLQDEFDEIKADRDQLARKVNTIDKYKQKLQTMQDTEKENNHLRNALEEARQLHENGDKAQGRIYELERTIEGYKKLISTIEQELSDQRIVKMESERKYAELSKRAEASDIQYKKDQDRITELIEQLDVETSRRNGGSLETELIKDENEETKLVAKCTLLWTRVAYLRRFTNVQTQNDQLKKNNLDRDARITMLESMLAVAKQRIANLEEHIGEASTKPGYRYEYSPACLSGSTLTLTDMSVSDEAEQEAEQAELEKEKALFKRDSGKGKQFTNFATVIEEMAENGEIVVINKSELSRLQQNEGALDELRSKGAENEQLQTRIKDLEVQVEQHQNVISDVFKGSGADDTLKLIEAATKRGATQNDSQPGGEAHIAILLESLNKAQGTVEEKSKVQESSSYQGKASFLVPQFPRPKPPAVLRKELAKKPDPPFSSPQNSYVPPNPKQTSKRRSWLPAGVSRPG